MAVGLIVLAVLAVLGLAGYLLFPVLAQQISQLASYLPDALSQFVERLRNLAGRLGIQTGGGSISPSTLAHTLLAVPISVVTGVLVDELWFRRLEEEEVSESSG